MKNKPAFTLIELLVVVLIIGILAAVALPQYQTAVEKARGTEALTLLRAILTAEQVYHMSTGQTTGNLADLDIDMPSGSSGNTFTIKNTTYSFDSANTSFIARRTYKSQTYVLQANFAGSTDDVPSWEIVCAAPTGNNICQVLGFSSTPYTTGGYGKYYRKE